MADMGRPPIFSTPEELQAKVDQYFVFIAGEKGMTVKEGEKEITEWVRWPEPATVTGMALFLGFESRQSVYDYEEKGHFSYIIKKARMRVECEYEKRLSGTTPTGSIFALKNMGWKDRSEIAPVDPDGNALNPFSPDQVKEILTAIRESKSA